MTLQQSEELALPSVSAVAWGDPLSVRTYSGLPAAIFGRYKKQGRLLASRSARPGLLRSLCSGRISFRRDSRGWRPCNPLWRYTERGFAHLTRSLASLRTPEPGAGVVFQFGVAGLPPGDAPLVAHVELPISEVFENGQFATSYGYQADSEAEARQAREVEKRFLDACSIIWTNTEFTKAKFPESVRSKVRVLTPGSKLSFPRRDWELEHEPQVLFIGRNWENKGGDLLLQAMKLLWEKGSTAKLVVIGCSPRIDLEHVEVLGLLDLARDADRTLFERKISTATCFCMPSKWETTGMVYWEAACSDLPVIMLRIPSTDHLFPDELFDKINEPCAGMLADVLSEYLDSRETARVRGQAAGEFSRRRFGPESFFGGIDRLVEEACDLGRR